jgi:hypothetical protein
MAGGTGVPARFSAFAEAPAAALSPTPPATTFVGPLRERRPCGGGRLGPTSSGLPMKPLGAEIPPGGTGSGNDDLTWEDVRGVTGTPPANSR